MDRQRHGSPVHPAQSERSVTTPDYPAVRQRLNELGCNDIVKAMDAKDWGEFKRLVRSRVLTPDEIELIAKVAGEPIS